ncbi:MAG: hypothetical protein QXG97_00275 [Nitrososphaerota archaeon]
MYVLFLVFGVMMEMLNRRNEKPAMCIIFAVLMFSSLLLASVVQAQEEQPVTVTSDKEVYKHGDTVAFTFSGLGPNQTYQLEISRKGIAVHTVEIITNSDGNPTEDVVWSTGDAEPGTYNYVLKNNSGEELGRGTLGIVGINKERFSADEEILISGGGAVAGEEVTAELRNDSTVLATASVSSDSDGEFSLSIKIPYDAANGTYAVVVNVSGNVITFSIEIETTSSQLLENTELIFDDLLGNVSGINASIVDSLVAKLRNAKMKVESAEELLAEGKMHVARNMLRAARNMLTAFIHEVRAQRGKHLDEATADSLISAAQGLIMRIEYLMTQLDNQNVNETTSILNKNGNGGDRDKGENRGDKGKDNENHGKSDNGNHKGKKK